MKNTYENRKDLLPKSVWDDIKIKGSLQDSFNEEFENIPETEPQKPNEEEVITKTKYQI